MTREELKSCSGFVVRLTLDGEACLATLYSDDPSRAYIVPCPPGEPGLRDVLEFELSDEDILSMSLNGSWTIFSPIDIQTAAN
jgi:hypothetical protein